jgi:MSHA pilin protein MshD
MPIQLPKQTTQRGVTLVELVIAITIVAIAATTVLGAMSAITTRSADAMIQQQAIVVAQAYLEEVLQRPVVDPDGVEPESGRGTYDDVDDYSGLADTGAHDQFGNAIAALADYNVAVSVSQSSALTSVPSSAARRIDITVTHTSGVIARLSGYRAAY